MAQVEGAFDHSIAYATSMAAGIPFAAVTRWPSWLRCSAMVLLLGSTLPSLSRTGMVCALLALVLSLTLLRTDIGPRWRVGTLAGLGAAGAVGLSRLLDVFARAGREQSGSAEYRGTILVLMIDVIIGIFIQDSLLSESIFSSIPFDSLPNIKKSPSL